MMRGMEGWLTLSHPIRGLAWSKNRPLDLLVLREESSINLVFLVETWGRDLMLASRTMPNPYSGACSRSRRKAVQMELAFGRSGEA